MLLPEFQPESRAVDAWWRLAQDFLVEAYPHPTDPKILNEDAPALNNLIHAARDKKNRAGIETEF